MQQHVNNAAILYSTRAELLRAPELLEVLWRIEPRGTFHLAHRVRSVCSRVLRYARATGQKCEDVAADLVVMLTAVASEHMAATVEPAKATRDDASLGGLRGFAAGSDDRGSDTRENRSELEVADPL